ncbi:hypothetical protein TPHA_0A03380 [Tetrapisispora phaffii CBS 4417]|uniref:Dilute domain-containing protein n=1 Tax=Tetrapisispora phaffii (strain ATCC 24235 / CBS 4417 / NBRC 1672 / NRRL Y-8282 / UCD 70-5) TaxID=1071381 RepID=G8BND7_TETPH|nr:hypothetical protein TPHA_0A03380 [Tetrapisispora phaffii CBS 4417]CCE61415.1 hypothetical protein TPHA_0A03380 [Tetrapisispora phaffii CBS 4417]
MADIWGGSAHTGGNISAGNDDSDMPDIDLKIANLGLNVGESDTFDGLENKKDQSLFFGTDSTYSKDDMSHSINKGSSGNVISNDDDSNFDYDKLIKYQYLEFEEYDIPKLLKLLINLPNKYPHVTTYPAGFLFQLIRYADHKKNSPSLVKTLVTLSIAKILSAVNTDEITSEETQINTDETVAGNSEDNLNIPDEKNATPISTRKNANSTKSKPGDIVGQSYWFATLTFLNYYFYKDESFYKRYPSILQEMIDALHSIMIQLVASINARLSDLIDSTILEYTTIHDVKQKLYKSDWNFFKKRRQAKAAKQEIDKKNEETDSIYYDHEILKHLFPPSLEEQMKPSPIKLVQIFGALVYVLDLHKVHPLYQQQCMSMAVQWFSTNLFNRIIKDRSKKSLSRAHAIQIRLNLDTVNTWIKNNDLEVQKPAMIDDFMWQLFPYTLVKDVADINLNIPTLRNIATYKPIIKDELKGKNKSTWVYDTNNSLFYYQSFHRISKIHLEPVYQLLQWLQVATTLDTEEALDATMALVDRLTPIQLLKSIEHYSYEIDEHKFKSVLKKKLSTLTKLPNHKNDLETIEKLNTFLVLPTIAELIDSYNNVEDKRSYQPFIPDDVEDAAYEIHDDNFKARREAEEYAELHNKVESDDNDDESEDEDNNDNDNKDYKNDRESNTRASDEDQESSVDDFHWGVTEPDSNKITAPPPGNNTWNHNNNEFESNPW